MLGREVCAGRPCTAWSSPTSGRGWSQNQQPGWSARVIRLAAQPGLLTPPLHHQATQELVPTQATTPASPLAPLG